MACYASLTYPKKHKQTNEWERPAGANCRGNDTNGTEYTSYGARNQQMNVIPFNCCHSLHTFKSSPTGKSKPSKPRIRVLRSPACCGCFVKLNINDFSTIYCWRLSAPARPPTALKLKNKLDLLSRDTPFTTWENVNTRSFWLADLYLIFMVPIFVFIWLIIWHFWVQIFIMMI